MKKRIIAICGIVIAVMILVVFFKHRTKPAINETTQAAKAVNQEPINPKAPRAPSSQSSNAASASNAPRKTNLYRPETRTPEYIHQKMIEDWQKPIDFYGKVVDVNTNPVAGASIQFQWADMTENVAANTAKTESDAEGLFSLHGKLGRSLEVWVSKEGYYASHGGYKGFLYSLGDDIYFPDPMNPIIFRLRKKGQGESLIQKDFPPGIGQIAQLRGNGTPMEIDLLNAKKASEGNGQLKLELWRGIVDKANPKYDWKCQLSVPNGGLVPTDEEFAFQAPEKGYEPSIVIDMPTTNQTWQGEIRNKYYIHLPDGKYGRIDFFLLPYNGVITIKSVINPSGSRNLEPK